jgi:hypothetical protein
LDQVFFAANPSFKEEDVHATLDKIIKNKANAIAYLKLIYETPKIINNKTTFPKKVLKAIKNKSGFNKRMIKKNNKDRYSCYK